MTTESTKRYLWRQVVIGISIAAILAVAGCAKSDAQNSEVTQGADSKSKIRHSSTINTKELAEFIEKEREQAKVTGVSVVLVKDNETLMAKGFGFADEKAHITATAKTIYRIGSVSKQFTSIAFMQLVEQGKASLDAPITDYVPELKMRNSPEEMKTVTARRIMTHHSGLPGNTLKGLWSEDKISLGELIKDAEDSYLAQKPDLAHSYSNLGYLVLGKAVENISGQEFSNYTVENIFKPLGMSHTSYVRTPEMGPYLSKGYLNGVEAHEAPINIFPAGSMFSSAEDMGKFIKAILHGGAMRDHKIIAKSTIDEMMSAQNDNVPLDFGKMVGLGWNINDFPIDGLGKVVHHAGGTPLFRTMLVILPDLGYGFAIFTNSTSGEIVMEAATMKILEAISQTAEAKKLAEASKTANGQSQAKYQHLSCDGHYTVENRGYVEARSENNALRIIRNGKEFLLPVTAEGSYDMKNMAGKDRFIGGNALFCARIADHNVMVAVAESGLTLVGEKFEPVEITPAWRSRLGSYDIEGIGRDMPLYTNYRLDDENGILLLRYSMPFFEDHDGPAVLKPISDDQAIVLGLGRNTGDIITVKNDGDGEYLYYAGLHLKKKTSKN